MFWMNGSLRSVNTLELFTFVRELPEPMPIDMIMWASSTSALAGTGTEWSIKLKGNLYQLVASIYEHHEAIPHSYSGDHSSVSVVHRIRDLHDCCSKIYQLADLTRLAPISVWTTEIEGVDESVAHFELALGPVFHQVIKIPHIRESLRDADILMRESERRARRLEAAFNRTLKQLQRGLPENKKGSG
jgi:hypothetical protein